MCASVCRHPPSTPDREPPLPLPTFPSRGAPTVVCVQSYSRTREYNADEYSCFRIAFEKLSSSVLDWAISSSSKSVWGGGSVNLVNLLTSNLVRATDLRLLSLVAKEILKKLCVIFFARFRLMFFFFFFNPQNVAKHVR